MFAATGNKNSDGSSRPSFNRAVAKGLPRRCICQGHTKKKGQEMRTTARKTIALGFVGGTMAVWALLAAAQNNEAREKPRLYTYSANWVIPRAKWDDMEKASTADSKILEAAVAKGSILAYGDNETLVHQVEGSTHDNWWVATSIAGLLDTLEEFYKSKSAVSPVLASATKHWDSIYVSRFYGWRAGTVKGGYVHGAAYKFKSSAPNDALETLSKNFIAPLFEKLMADGTVQAYQIAEESVHTTDPDMFFIFYVTPNSQGIDKTNAALRAALGENALAGPAFSSLVDYSVHRDDLGRANATFK